MEMFNNLRSSLNQVEHITEKLENSTKVFREEINTIYYRLLGEITTDLGKEIK